MTPQEMQGFRLGLLVAMFLNAVVMACVDGWYEFKARRKANKIKKEREQNDKR